MSSSSVVWTVLMLILPLDLDIDRSAANYVSITCSVLCWWLPRFLLLLIVPIFSCRQTCVEVLLTVTVDMMLSDVFALRFAVKKKHSNFLDWTFERSLILQRWAECLRLPLLWMTHTRDRDHSFSWICCGQDTRHITGWVVTHFSLGVRTEVSCKEHDSAAKQPIVFHIMGISCHPR